MPMTFPLPNRAATAVAFLIVVVCVGLGGAGTARALPLAAPRAGDAASAPAPAPTPAPAAPAADGAVKPPEVVIGVWYQPIDSFDKWKARGVNTLFGYEAQSGTVSREQWTAAARAKGLFYVTQASADVKKDSADPYLLAWLHKVGPDASGVTYEQLAAEYAAFKAAGDKPVAVMFDGRKMAYRPSRDYANFAKSADWLLEDYYAANYGDGPAGVPTLGQRLDTLKKVGPDKRLGAMIETSNQKIGIQDWTKAKVPGKEKDLSEYMRGPTGEEVLAQFDMARKHGASVFVIFPDVFGKSWESYDGQTEEQTAAEVKAIQQIKAEGQK